MHLSANIIKLISDFNVNKNEVFVRFPLFSGSQKGEPVKLGVVYLFIYCEVYN